jgi:hypothetical protein
MLEAIKKKSKLENKSKPLLKHILSGGRAQDFVAPKSNKRQSGGQGKESVWERRVIWSGGIVWEVWEAERKGSCIVTRQNGTATARHFADTQDGTG